MINQHTKILESVKHLSTAMRGSGEIHVNEIQTDILPALACRNIFWHEEYIPKFTAPALLQQYDKGNTLL